MESQPQNPEKFAHDVLLWTHHLSDVILYQLIISSQLSGAIVIINKDTWCG